MDTIEKGPVIGEQGRHVATGDEGSVGKPYYGYLMFNERDSDWSYRMPNPDNNALLERIAEHFIGDPDYHVQIWPYEGPIIDMERP